LIEEALKSFTKQRTSLDSVLASFDSASSQPSSFDSQTSADLTQQINESASASQVQQLKIDILRQASVALEAHQNITSKQAELVLL
jgi:hypothetical protein